MTTDEKREGTQKYKGMDNNLGTLGGTHYQHDKLPDGTHESRHKHCKPYSSSAFQPAEFASEDKFGPNKNVDKVVIKAKALLDQKQIKQASIFLEECINMGVSHADVFYLAGETQRKLGNTLKAEQHLLKALEF